MPLTVELVQAAKMQLEDGQRMLRETEHSTAGCGKGSRGVPQEPEAGILCCLSGVTAAGEGNMSVTVWVNYSKNTAEFIS